MSYLEKSQFNARKAGQVIFYFLHQAKDLNINISKLRLIKWIYLAERETYLRLGRPLIGDRLCSLKHGPVPSETLAIIEKKNQEWKHLIHVEHTPSRHQYITISKICEYRSPDDLDEFTKSEDRILSDIWKEYGRLSGVKLEERLHNRQKFTEWEWKEGDKTNWISLEKLFSSLGFNSKDSQNIIEEITGH